MSERLKAKERISYGAGNLGICMVTTVFSVFLSYFYTNVVGIDPVQVGTIMLAGGIADAVSDVVMGAIVDKTNTKWGKCRPYILFMAIPLVVFSFLVFNVPNAEPGVKYMYALITYCLYVCVYTAIFIPYTTLMSCITNNQEDRLSVNMWQGLGSSIGQFIINSFGLSIVAALGDGIKGYRYAIIVFALIGAVLLVVCFMNTKERVLPPKNEKIELKDTLQALKNSQWLIVCLTVFLALTAVVLRAQQTMYYAQYVMEDISIASKLLAISTVVAIPVALVTPKLALKFGKRNLLIAGAVLYVAASAGMYLFRMNSVVVYGFAFLAGIGGAVPNNVCYVMTAETIDYGEWKNGKRVQGALMSLIGFAVKVGGSLGGMIANLILDMGGYDGSAAVQSAAAQNAISINFIVLPAAMFLGIIVINLFYKLDKMYPQIKADLDQRRTAVSGDLAGSMP